MDLNAAQQSSAVELVSCIISKPNNLISTRVLLGGDAILNFDFRENLLSPFVGGTLTISDAANFVSTFPITGGENIELTVRCSFSDEPIVHNLVVNNIQGRIMPDEKKQLYVLKLVSKELMINEQIRVKKRLNGTIDEIVKELLDNFLKTPKDINIEASNNKFKKIPSDGGDRPFDVIAELITKFIPKISKKKLNDLKKFNKKVKQKEKKISGTAGSFFWETRRGFNLTSCDTLCTLEGKDGKPLGVHGPYIEQTANTEPQEVAIDPRFNIKTVFFPLEVDVMSSLRSGKLTKRVTLFNISTQEYEEVVYSLSDNWNQMAHLGNQNDVDNIDFSPAGELVGLSAESEVTRNMSFIIDHEAFFNEPQVGNPEDNSKPENPNEAFEAYKFFAAQSSARFDLLTNQQCVVKIPGNPFICAGDKVQLILRAKVPDTVSDTMKIDVESSGVYLVKEVTHNYTFSEGTSGICETTLRLMRDAYGLKTEPSAHGT